MSPPPKLRARTTRAILLLVASLPFAGALGAEFVRFDDYRTVVENPHWRGLDAESLRWMFGSFYNGHYHPLTWLSFAVDHALWGLEPAAFHATNLVLHAGNAVLVWGLLRDVLARAGVGAAPWATLAGTLFFAWHPLRVESVAWVTERRDVLSALFWLVAVTAYLRVHRPGRPACRGAYALALAAFTASLLAKAWGITLPVVLLVLDLYPLRRRPSARLLVEKLPFFALAALFAVLAALAQSERAALSLEVHSTASRLMQSAYGFWFYPWKTLLPFGLSPLHPIAEVDFTEWRFCLAAVGALAVPVVLVLARRPAWAAAWAVYFVVVSPVLGLLQSGPQLVAERYSYLSCLPFAALAAAGLARVGRGGGAARMAGGAAAVGLAVLALLSVRQTRVWDDSEALWSRVVAVYPDHFRSHLGLAGAYFHDGRWAEAEAEYRRCAELSPDLYEPWAFVGLLAFEDGRPDEALRAWRRAWRLAPRNPEALWRMASVHHALGNPEATLDFCRRLHAVRPNHARGHLLAGEALQALGRDEAAREAFQRAVEANPALAERAAGH